MKDHHANDIYKLPLRTESKSSKLSLKTTGSFIEPYLSEIDSAQLCNLSSVMKKDVASSTVTARPQAIKADNPANSEPYHRVALASVTVLAFWTRFCGLGHPSEVVFDEAHIVRVGVNRGDQVSNKALFAHNGLNSSPRGTSHEAISLTSTLPSEDCCMHCLHGSLDTTATLSRTGRANRTFPTVYPMLRFVRCPLC